MAKTILIVDDSKLARMTVVKLLNDLRPGWIRIEAVDADDALAKAKQPIALHVALLDFNMPGRNGLELAKDLKAAHPAVSIGLISANSQQAVLDGVTAVGGAFLNKPLKGPALAAFLDQAEAAIDDPPRRS